MKQYLLISLLLISKTMSGQNPGFIFCDGNANCYFISDTQIVYKPITKLQSSSGEYDGGNPQTVTITKKTFTRLSKLAKKIITDKKEHELDRKKGDGIIEFDGTAVNFKGKSQSYKDITEMLFKVLQ